MHTYDFTPLFRHSVGFDHMQSVFDNMISYDQTASNTYPPYNIETVDKDSYRISMAIAGFSESDLEIVATEDKLTIKGEIGSQEERMYLHQGIAGRSFERNFSLADYVKVVDARMKNGLLHIDLVREVPESKKPRKIEIKNELHSSIKAKTDKFIGRKDKAVA